MSNGSKPAVTRRQADLAAGLLVGAVVLLGLLFAWNAYQQREAIDGMNGGMMGSSSMMDSMMYTGPDPIWYVFGTLILAGAIGGAYVLLRSELVAESSQTNEPMPRDALDIPAGGDSTTGPQAGDQEPALGTEPNAGPDPAAENPPANPKPSESILQVLPDDERRVLEPVLDSPGLTQIALRDRSDFSKSKVSQTVSELEKRGLIYRERQGRTYRVYPSDELAGSE